MSELLVKDPNTGKEYPFLITPTESGDRYSLSQVDWELAEAQDTWRVPLFPWDGGLHEDRINNRRSYAKANADLSNRGLCVPPPLLNSLTLPSSNVDEVPFIRGTDSKRQGSGSSIELTLPTTTADNDSMFAVITTQDLQSSITSTGWTVVDTVDYSANRAVLLRKVASSEGATVTFSWSSSAQNSGAIIVFDGVNTTTQLDDNQSTTGATVNADTPTLTLSSDSFVVSWFVENSGRLFTGDSGQNLEESTTGGAPNLYMFTSYETGASASHGGDWDLLPETWAAIGIVVNPVSAAPSYGDWQHHGQFNSRDWFSDGRHLISIDDSYNVTHRKDFGSNRTLTDLQLFNSELIIAMDKTGLAWSVNTDDDYTESVDVKGQKFSVVGEFLWRAEGNELSNCTTGPLTLSNYVPADPNEYTVGDSTTDINAIVDYGGIPWVGKPEGMFAPDAVSRFHNQTPQLRRYPDSNNCVNSFTGQGFLWVPSIVGLLRLAQGESLPRGPEQSGRPDYLFHTHTGVEYGGALYIAAEDHNAVEDSFICKMLPDVNDISQDEKEYIYHEWCRLGGTDDPDLLAISTLPTQPTIYSGLGSALNYIKLGRGGGIRSIDDTGYSYGTSWELETGIFRPTNDLGIITGLVGVKVVLDHDSTESVDVEFALEQESTFNDMLSSQEGGGVNSITNTNGYAAIIRYAPPNTVGQFFRIKLTGSMTDAASGTDRPEVRELWAFGYIKSEVTDIVTIGIVSDSKVNNFTAQETLRLWRKWKKEQTILEMDIPDYEENQVTRFKVLSVSSNSEESNLTRNVYSINLNLMRIDYSGELANS